MKVLNSHRTNKNIIYFKKEMQNRSSPDSPNVVTVLPLGNLGHMWLPGHLYDKGTEVIAPQVSFQLYSKNTSKYDKYSNTGLEVT